MVCLTSLTAEILPWWMRSNALRTAARSSVDVVVVTGADKEGRVITGCESALASTIAGGSLASGRGRGSGKLAAADAMCTAVFLLSAPALLAAVVLLVLATGLRACAVAVVLRPCALALAAGPFLAGAACLEAACLAGF